MFGLLPLLFALAIVETAYHNDPVPFEIRHWLIPVGLSLVVWLGICEVVVRLLARARDRRWLDRWDIAAQGIALLWFAWICYWCGWVREVQVYTPAIMPWMLMQAIHWWSMAEAVRSVGGHPWTRGGMLMHHVRFGMLPMLIILPIFDLCNAATLRFGIQRWFIDHIGLQMTMVVGSLALGLVVVGLLPAFLVRLWRAVPLPAGEVRDALADACRQMGVGVRAIMIWPVPGGRVYNAAVLGVVPRIRYVLFTEDLLRDFDPPSLRAVLGHELGHARHGHLFVYLVFAIATLLASFLLAQPAAALVARIPGAHWLPVTVQTGIATVALLALKWRLIFGYLSRACERQADLAGAELVGDARVMQHALRTVARLSGQAEDAPSWRHYSIAQRAAFLERVAEDPQVALVHHRRVRLARFGLIVIVLALAATVAIIHVRSGMAAFGGPPPPAPEHAL
ncbi:MAG: M48 family metalloprotease [Planctomycetes bacterium]|nr:M48 family metalloprotease [Planctomycetota bacterium]